MHGFIAFLFRWVWLAILLGVFPFSVTHANGIPISSESMGIPKSPLPPPTRRSFETGPLSLGMTYVGMGVRLGISHGWSVEGRFTTGQETSEEGKVKSRFLSARVVKYFPGQLPVVPYGVLEGGGVSASDSSQNATGRTVGCAGGIEYPITQKFSVGFEMGPYHVRMKGKTAEGKNSTTEIAINSTIYWRIF